MQELSARAWRFIWHEESLASWLVNILLAFVLIKFLLYPGLGLLLGTPFPVVAVVSSSMEHHPSSFDDWWAASGDWYEERNITAEEFRDYPFRDGFAKGDIMLLTGADPDELAVGEVIVYWSGKPYPIIHRYVGDREVQGRRYLMSKGDNNPVMVRAPDLDERRIEEEQLLGRALLRLPFLGYVKIWAVELLDLIRRAI